MTRTFFFQVVLSIVLSTSAIAGETRPVKCPHHEEFDVEFTDWGAKDRFVIDLLGDDCTKSVRVITVRDGSGNPIYSNAIRLQQLVAQPLSRNGEVSRALGYVRKTVSGKRTSDLPEFESVELDDENFYTGGVENKENYTRARSADKPSMCVQIGYEYWECFWYDEELRSVKYLYGFGA